MIDPSPASGISVDRCMFCCYLYPKPIKKRAPGRVLHVWIPSMVAWLTTVCILNLMVVAYLGDRCYHYLLSFVLGVDGLGLVLLLLLLLLLFLQPNPLFWLVWLFVSLLHKITNKHTIIVIYITSGMLSVYMLALVQGLAVQGSSESLLLLAAILAGIIILSYVKYHYFT